MIYNRNLCASLKNIVHLFYNIIIFLVVQFYITIILTYYQHWFGIIVAYTLFNILIYKKIPPTRRVCGITKKKNTSVNGRVK